MKFSLEKEYCRVIQELTRTGIIAILPGSGKSGVIGIDSNVYPVPGFKQIQKLFARNEELLKMKIRQGFTRLQMTPIAMPVRKFVGLTKALLIKKASEGKIILAKKNHSDPDVPVKVNTVDPVWIWKKVSKHLYSSGTVYFPEKFILKGHKGFIKKAVILDSSFCAFPGWSAGLVEPMVFIPRKGRGKTKRGRKQIEAGSAPQEYLKMLNLPAYNGETGWTLEDFLTYFMCRLEGTCQISSARSDDNALWLIGSYIPRTGIKFLKDIVPEAVWGRGRLYISTHRSANKFKSWGTRTIVRIGSAEKRTCPGAQL